MSTFQVKFDRAALEKVTIDEFIEIQEGNMRTLKSVLAKNVYSDGQVLLNGQGESAVGQLTIGQLRGIMKQINQAAKDLVPE